MTTIETQSLSTWWRILSRSIVLWLSNDVIVCPLHADQTRNPIPFPSCRFLEVLAASDWLVSGQVQFAGCAVRDSCSGVQIRSSGDIRAPVGHSRLATLIVTVCSVLEKYRKKSGNFKRNHRHRQKVGPLVHIWQQLEWCVSWDFVAEIFGFLN